MLEQLQPDCYSKVAAFFDDNDTVLHCRCCWRDLQLELSMLMNRARLAFALTVEGYFLGGDHDTPASLQALGEFLQQKVFTAEIFQSTDASFSLGVSSAS